MCKTMMSTVSQASPAKKRTRKLSVVYVGGDYSHHRQDNHDYFKHLLNQVGLVGGAWKVPSDSSDRVLK